MITTATTTTTTIIIVIMYIYRALINALNAHIIDINLNMIFYTEVGTPPVPSNLCSSLIAVSKLCGAKSQRQYPKSNS